MKLISPVFENNSAIPPKYTCQGENINPPLNYVDVPEDAQSLALVVDDPDAPSGNFVHWLVWDIDPATPGIGENSVPEHAVQGRNDFGRQNYGGPCPHSGTHRYCFRLYALKTKLNLPPSASKSELEEAMKDKIIKHAEIGGQYVKQ
ncbi:MAG TPA: YbhB/YbcL family Raf kinase inhibitor-like protein [Candidatus Dormibacteraeota bacterium]|nr:YbhB/YbcL family Raf kinase inhibitor-like protein [Candidatus Dormibacteraeota bacterium]